MWKPWVGLDDHPGGEGRVERELPDGRKVMVPHYVDGPTPHLILKRTFAGRYGQSRWYEEAESAYPSDGLARGMVGRRLAEPLQHTTAQV